MIGLKKERKTLPTTSGLAQWRQYPAETEVKIWKILPRMKGSGSRHCAKPPGRCVQADEYSVDNDVRT
jgi:hypothetical protein